MSWSYSGINAIRDPPVELASCCAPEECVSDAGPLNHFYPRINRGIHWAR